MLACWNWALTGFGPGPINPDSIFNYVAGNAQVVVVLPGIITGTAALMNRLDELRGDWGLIAANDVYDVLYASASRPMTELREFFDVPW